MQRFLAKYGLAAHLALVAVAPLFLFPFCPAHDVARAVLWLALLAALWFLAAPSTRRGEPLHVARQRVWRATLRDPLFWLSLVLILFSGLRALNGGVRMAYDAEKSAWSLATAAVAEFPGCVEGAGFLPFAATVALAVVVIAARQALGRSARTVFLLLASAFAGLAASVALVAAFEGHAACAALFDFPNAAASFFGGACGVWFLAGTAALVSSFEQKWHAALVAIPFSVGGTALGAFAFAPPAMSGLFAAAALPVLAFAFFYARKVLHGTGDYRMLVVYAVALTTGGLAVAFLMPEAALAARLDAFANRAFVPEGFLDARRVLSDIALRTWKTAPWIGTGVGSFALDVRFQALAAEWPQIPRGLVALANGGWLLLVERGLVGAALVALPFGFLLFTYARRIVLWATERRLPHPAALLAPLVVLVLAPSVPFDASFLRADVLLAAAAVLAVSAKAFPHSELTSNG